MLPFIIIILAILLGVHFFVYYVLILIFGITKFKVGLGILFLILSTSFLFSTISLHYYNNSLTKNIYYFASVWNGLISNLFFLFIALSIIILIFKLFQIHIDLKYPGIGFMVLAFLMTGYGMYNANQIVVSEVGVRIKNLPEAWKNKNVLMISDVHIGAIIGESFLEKMIYKINSLNPDIVFITGDLFDGTDGDLKQIPDFLDNIDAKDGIYYVNGNHETYLGNDITNSILEKTKIHVLDDEFVNLDGLQIVGISYIDTRFGGVDVKTKLQSLNTFDKSIASILLYHAPVYLDYFKDFGINLQLSGHTHKGQFWPFGYITNIVYNGKDYGLYSDGDYNLYTTNGVGTWGPPLRFGNNPEIVLFKLSDK